MYQVLDYLDLLPNEEYGSRLFKAIKQLIPPSRPRQMVSGNEMWQWNGGLNGEIRAINDGRSWMFNCQDSLPEGT